MSAAFTDIGHALTSSITREISSSALAAICCAWERVAVVFAATERHTKPAEAGGAIGRE